MDTNTGYPQAPQPPVPPTPPPGYVPAQEPQLPYQPAQVGYAPEAVAPPKKKRKGCLIAAIIAVVLLLGCIGTVLVVAAVTTNDDAVAYSDADFDSAINKVGLVWPELPADADPAAYERVYTGQKAVDVTLTEAELSALMSFRHDSSYWPIKSMDVELAGGNTARASMVVSYAGRDWPVEVSGSGEAAGGGLNLNLNSASVMGMDIPAEYLPMASDILENIINPRLSRAGITIDTLVSTEDGAHFVGTTWESAEYVPK